MYFSIIHRKKNIYIKESNGDNQNIALWIALLAVYLFLQLKQQTPEGKKKFNLEIRQERILKWGTKFSLQKSTEWAEWGLSFWLETNIFTQVSG